MQLSIIIVNYNVEHYLELCLDSVFAAITFIDAEVIVVDNASQDRSASMVAKRFPTVHFVSNNENLGFSIANNQGVRLSKGEYICILNPDTVVAEDTFEKVDAFAKAKQNAGVIGVRLVDGSGKFLPESKRNLPTPKVSLNKMMGDGSAYYANNLSSLESGKVDVLVGAFMFMKKSVYEEVGGFDEKYFMYGEDIDLSYTIMQKGYENYYLGEEAIIHFKGESTVKDKIYRKRFYGAMRLFYEKHLRKNAIESTMVRVGLQGAMLKSGLHSDKPVQISQSPLAKGNIYFLQTNNDELCHAFAKAVSTKVNRLEGDSALSKDSELVFDATSSTYKGIIDEMIMRQNQEVTFKIIPKNSTFAIGSNSREGRGEVIQFGEE